jgi:hypothetical protein
VQVPVLSEIRLAADPAAWAAAGFEVVDGGCSVGGVQLEFVAGEGGIVDWGLTGVKAAGIDGLPTRLAADPPAAGEDGAHPNAVSGIDHVVVMTPRLERTIEAFEEAGVELRRIREGETGMGRYRQAFFRLGRPILEVVEAADMDDGAPPRHWGITFTTEDIDAAAALLGERLGGVKDAVQPGRRIATVRKEAGLGLPVALITPHVATA